MIAATSFLDALSAFSLVVLAALAAGTVLLAWASDRNRKRALQDLNAGLDHLEKAQTEIRSAVRNVKTPEYANYELDVEAFLLAYRATRSNMPRRHIEALASTVLADKTLAADLSKLVSALEAKGPELKEIASNLNQARALLGQLPASALEEAERKEQLRKLPSSETASQVLAYLVRADIAESGTRFTPPPIEPPTPVVVSR